MESCERLSICTATLAGNLSDQFKSLTERLHVVGCREDINIVPYLGDQPAYFSLLSYVEQLRIIAHFKRYVETCESLQRSGGYVTKDRQLVWQFLVRNNLKPPAGIFEEFENLDIIEIYDSMDWVQIFRNFNFFKVCSYTLDDILARPWWELYQRDRELTSHVLSVSRQAASDKSQSIYHYRTGEHLQIEVGSVSMFHSKIENRFVVSLIDEHKEPAAVLNVIKPISVVPKSGSVPNIDVIPLLKIRCMTSLPPQ